MRLEIWRKLLSVGVGVLWQSWMQVIYSNSDGYTTMWPRLRREKLTYVFTSLQHRAVPDDVFPTTPWPALTLANVWLLQWSGLQVTSLVDSDSLLTRAPVALLFSSITMKGNSLSSLSSTSAQCFLRRRVFSSFFLLCFLPPGRCRQFLELPEPGITTWVFPLQRLHSMRRRSVLLAPASTRLLIKDTGRPSFPHALASTLVFSSAILGPRAPLASDKNTRILIRLPLRRVGTSSLFRSRVEGGGDEKETDCDAGDGDLPLSLVRT